MTRLWLTIGLLACITLKSLVFFTYPFTPTAVAEETDEEAEGTSEESDFA